MAIGWNSGDTQVVKLFQNSGDYTYSGNLCGGLVPEECETITGATYNIPLSGWSGYGDSIQIEISKSGSVSGCNKDMMVTWFKQNIGLSGVVINDASAFTHKNIDDCNYIITRDKPSSHPFSSAQTFSENSYVDSGYPFICVNPYTDKNTPKYSGGTTYGGHKIKYGWVDNSSGLTIPTKCIVNNPYLTEIYFPTNNAHQGLEVHTIRAGAFSGNTSLSAVTFGGTKYIGDEAFRNCSALEIIDFAHEGCTSGSKLKSIGKQAFQNCDSLTRVDIPSSVSSIGSSAFTQCDDLTEVNIGVGVYSSSVINIGDYAFLSCINLTNCTIGSGVTNIGERAFEHCPNLTSIDIPSGVTSIGGYAFASCSGLTSIKFHSEIPPGLNTDGSTFLNVAENGVIYVPSDTKVLYEQLKGIALPNWDIVEYS